MNVKAFHCSVTFSKHKTVKILYIKIINNSKILNINENPQTLNICLKTIPVKRKTTTAVLY